MQYLTCTLPISNHLFSVVICSGTVHDVVHWFFLSCIKSRRLGKKVAIYNIQFILTVTKNIVIILFIFGIFFYPMATQWYTKWYSQLILTTCKVLNNLQTTHCKTCLFSCICLDFKNLQTTTCPRVYMPLGHSNGNR
jgi:hypothetical protein